MAGKWSEDSDIAKEIEKLLFGSDVLDDEISFESALTGGCDDSARIEDPHERFMAFWSADFKAYGLNMPEVLRELKIKEDEAEDSEDVLRAMSLLLGKLPVVEEQLSVLADRQLSGAAELCLRAGAFKSFATAEVRKLAKDMTGDGRARLRCALALCRETDADRLPIAFDEQRYAAALAGLPPCYHEDFTAAAGALRRCVESGQRVSVLVNMPDGAPAEDFAQALAACVSRGPLPAASIDAGSLSSAIDLLGCAATFSQAALGQVARSVFENGDRGLIVYHAESLANLKKSGGDPVLFLASLARRGVFRDAYLGVEASFSSPLLIVRNSAARDNGFASCCSVNVSVHVLGRDEKVAEVRRQLDAAKVAYASDVPECVVDGYCFDDGVESATNCCRLLVAYGAQREGGVLRVQDVAQALPAPNANDPRTWYGSKRDMLSPDADALARTLLASALDVADPASEQARRRLKMLMAATPDGTRLPLRAAAEVKDAISCTHPLLGGIGRMAKVVAASLRAAHPRPLLLVGPAGVGKTTLCESLSAALGGVPFAKRDFPGLSTSEVFGSQTQPSLLTEAVAAHDGAPGVLLIDEVDKPGCCAPTSLLSLLDEGRVADSFLNAPVDLSRWLVVLTANDLEKVSPYLVDRCTVVDVLGYTPNAKATIAKAALVKRLGEKLGLADVDVSDAALRYLAQLDDAAGLRGFEKRLEQLIAVEGDRGTVGVQEARELFPARPAATAGIRVVMGRGGSAGGAALGCVGAVRGEGNFGVSCLSGVSAVEHNAKLVQIALAQLRIMPKAVHLSLAEADDLQACHCPDAMLGFGVALALAEAGLPVELERTAFMGAVRLSGEIALDGGDELAKAPFIVARAAAYGCDELVCPALFASAPEAKQAAKQVHVELVGVERLEQAIEFAKDAVQLRELVMTL